MKKTIVALFATVCMAGAAFAQTTPATTTSPAATAAPMGMASEGGFVTYQQADQLLGSGLMNANVRGADNENIGTVSDLVLDRDGQIVAVVVGVGGFLGIGQKNVAIAEDQLNFVLAQDAAASTTTGAMAPAGGTAMAPAGGTAMAPAGGTAMAPTDTTAATGTATAPAATTPMASTGTAAAPGAAATGTGMSGTVATGTDEAFGWSGAGIDHIQVAYTRQQLQDAPAFETAE